MTIRVLIADDEPLARRHLARILETDNDVVLVGECSDGRDAVEAIRRLTPDLVLLDVQMPELDGFGVVSAVGVEQMPAVIFVTAYDAYAVKAFDVHAIDYVLKPVARDRFLRAIARAKQRHAAGDGAQQADRLRRWAAAAQERRTERIAVRVDGRHLVLATRTIDWIEAVDDYVRIHIGRSSHLVRGTLQGFAGELPPTFLRIHRSAIVNTERVREVSTTAQGDFRVTLEDGTRLPSGRSYRSAVAEYLASFTVGQR